MNILDLKWFSSERLDNIFLNFTVIQLGSEQVCANLISKCAEVDNIEAPNSPPQQNIIRSSACTISAQLNGCSLNYAQKYLLLCELLYYSLFYRFNTWYSFFCKKSMIFYSELFWYSNGQSSKFAEW